MKLLWSVLPNNLDFISMYDYEFCYTNATKKRSPKSVTVKIDGTDQEYQVLNTLEFTNVRKRMSVIVQGPDGKIVLYCKGADNVILERLGDNQQFKEQTLTHLEEFAGQGLRTLCLAKVELDQERYQEWSKLYSAAATTIVNRDQELEIVAELIEKDLFLLGATAVEDKLQDGVPETIATLAKAGIKIWVLTGDKQETAINIGFACRLLTKEMELLVINETTKEETRNRIDKLLQKYDNVQVSEVSFPSCLAYSFVDFSTYY
jgi:phospholipid-transporting ATPase